MRAGRLRENIDIQVNTPTKVNHERVASWSTVSTVRAQRLDPKGSEVSSALLSESDMTIIFRIRHRSGVTPKHRLKFGTRIYDIRAVTNPDGMGRMMDLHCTEHLSDGD